MKHLATLLFGLFICLQKTHAVPAASPAPDTARALRIGVVDSARLLAQYHKTAQAEESLREAKEQAKRELDERGKRLQDIAKRFQEAAKLAADPAISEELRAQKRRAAEELQAEAQSLEQEIREFRQRRERQLQDQLARLTKGLNGEIRARVEQRARDRGFDLIFDRSATGLNGVPFLLYAKDAADFTDDVLKELNATAPEAPAPGK